MKILTKACQSPVFAFKLSVLVSPRLYYILLHFLSLPSTISVCRRQVHMASLKTIFVFLSWKIVLEIGKNDALKVSMLQVRVCWTVQICAPEWVLLAAFSAGASWQVRQIRRGCLQKQCYIKKRFNCTQRRYFSFQNWVAWITSLETCCVCARGTLAA